VKGTALRIDIFTIKENGDPCWLGAAEDLNNAKLRLQQLVTTESSRQFLLLDQMTGNKMIVTADEIGLAKSKTSSIAPSPISPQSQGRTKNAN